MTSFNLSSILIYLAKKTQIVLLLAEKVKILAKYSDLWIFFQKKSFVIARVKLTFYQAAKR